MAISTYEFVRHYPSLFHMAEANTWNSIRTHGLLSTTALLNLFEIDGVVRKEIELSHRPSSVEISHEMYGKALIRDQKPMRPSALAKCLVGVSPTQWLQLLNSKVFFWPTEERLLRLLNGKEYRDRTQLVIEVSTDKLLKAHSCSVTLSPINSGSTLYNAQQRGMSTFKSLSSYPFEERRRKRGVKNAVAELTVAHSVPDIEDFCIAVSHYRKGQKIESIV